jgi:ubiquinone/menaquinone biosynthesis C-methylase UbiE
MLKKLNLGCGTDIRSGWVNLDSAKLAGVDVVWDVERVPLPFRDAEFDEVLCQDILEHVNYVPILKDLHRILKDSGRITIRVPHFTSKNNYIDPTHKKMFSMRTFDFFTKHSMKGRGYYFDFAFGHVASARMTFELSSRLFFFNKLARWFFNRNRQTQDFYESTFLSRLFPAQNIIVTLVK